MSEGGGNLNPAVQGQDGKDNSRPRLRPGAIILRYSADQLQISFPNHTATFSHPSVTSGIEALIVSMDGTATKADVICRASAASGLSEDFVRYLFGVLDESQCLFSEGYSTSEFDRGSQISEFFAFLGRDPAQILASLQAARVLIVAHAPKSEQIAELFRSAGITVSEFVSVNTSSTCQAVISEIGRHVETGISMVACWGFPYRSPFARFLNDFAIERRQPVLFGACEGLVGRIGPYVIPRNTPCLECFNRRLLTHAGEMEARAFTQYRIRHTEVIPQPWPSHPLFSGAVERMFAFEAAEILRNVPPRTVGAVLEYSFSEAVAKRHSILKVPRCEACWPARPRRIAWDAKFEAPSVKDAS